MENCKGCPALVFEAWPKGAAVYICTSPDKPEHLGRRRVIDYRSLANQTPAPASPAWCPERRTYGK